MSKNREAAADIVAAYLRASADEQAQSGADLDAQRATIEAEAARRGWTIGGWYVDEGVSGGKRLDARPGLAAAVAAIENGQAGVLLAATLDRVSRSVADTALLTDRSRKGRWQLVTCDLQIDTSTPSGEAVAGMMAVFSQLERRLIGQRTREALAVKKAQGVRLGRPSTLPTGIVYSIVSQRASGVSYGKIADGLNAAGVPTAQGGKKWYPATVKKVLEGRQAARIAA